MGHVVRGDVSHPGLVCYRRSSVLKRASDAYAASAEMNSHEPLWPCGKAHILPVGRCTCAHSPALAKSSSTDALCISDVSAIQRAAAAVLNFAGVPMAGITSSSRVRGNQPKLVFFDDTSSGSTGEEWKERLR